MHALNNPIYGADSQAGLLNPYSTRLYRDWQNETRLITCIM